MRYRSTIASFAVAVLAAMSSFCSHAGLTSTWSLLEGWACGHSLVYPHDPVGAPAIPYLLLDVVVPDGGSLRGVEVVTSAYEVVSTGTAPDPIAKPRLPGAEPELTERDESLYVDRTAVYEIAGEETASGIRFLSVRVYPRHYLREGHVVKDAKALTLRFNWDVSSAAATRPAVSSELRALALAGDNVVEPDAATGAAASPRIVRLATSATSVPSADCVIITPPAFTNIWEKYKAYRERTTGYSFAIKNTDEIYAEFEGTNKTTILPGSAWVPDHALAIHKYIESVYTNGTAYVILGAAPPILNKDLNPVNQLPIRYVRTSDQTGADGDYLLPSDLYFACMDKNGGAEVWDYQGDGVYCGTGAVGATANATLVDKTGMDWKADLVVMRMPFAESITQVGITYTAEQMMAGFIDKIERCEAPGEAFSGRGKTMVIGGTTQVLGNYNHGSTVDKVISEREFFDDQYNIFDSEHPVNTLDVESDPRLMMESVFSRYRAPQRMYVIAGDMKNDETSRFLRKQNSNFPPPILEKLYPILYNDKFLKYSDAIQNDGDAYYVHAHGTPQGIDMISYYSDIVWKQTSVQKICFSSLPCLTGRIDQDTTGARCVAQAHVMTPNGGCVATFNNTRMGWASNVQILSTRIDRQLCLYAHGADDGVEYSAGMTLLKTRQLCSDMNDAGASSLTLQEVLGMGDPFIKFTPQRDRTWTGAAGDNTWSLTSTNWLSCVSSPIIASNSTEYVDSPFDTSRRVYAKTSASSQTYTVDGDFAATELRLEGPQGGQVEFTGGRIRSTVLTSVTNATTLVWGSAGGAGRDGIEFKGGKGTLVLPGNNKRYFGTKFSEVSKIEVTGGGVTLDFSYHAVAPAQLSFTADDASMRNVYTNIVRTKLANNVIRLAADATVPVANSTLQIENSGFLRGTDSTVDAIAATNADIVVRMGPRWDAPIVSRGISLNDSSLVLGFHKIQLGQSSHVWPVSVTGGRSSIESSANVVYTLAGDASFDIASGAALELMTSLNASGRTIAKKGAGVLEIPDASLLGGAALSIEDGEVVIPASTDVTVDFASDTARLVVLTSAAAIESADTEPVALFTYATGTTTNILNSAVELVDSATGETIDKGELVFVTYLDGYAYIAKEGAMPTEFSTLHGVIKGDAVWLDDENLIVDREWENGNFSTITLTNDTADARLTFGEDVTAKSFTLYGSKDLTFTNAPGVSVAIKTFDFSNHAAATRIDGFVASNVTAGCETFFDQPVDTDLVIPAGSAAVFNDFVVSDWIAAGGTLSGATSGILRYAGSGELEEFPYLSDNTPFTVALARPLASSITTLDIGAGDNSRTQNFIFEDGFSATVTQFRPCNGKGTCNITHTGGDIVVTGTNPPTGNSCSLLFAHWPGTLRYNMTGGTITGAGQMRLGWDGTAYLTVGGGSGEALVTVSGLSIPTARNGRGHLDVKTNGTVRVGSDGINIVTANSLALSGGRLSFTEDASAIVADGIAVNEPSIIEVAEGKSVEVVSALFNFEGFTKAGAGTLVATNIVETGSINVSKGTLRIVAEAAGAASFVHEGAVLEIIPSEGSDSTAVAIAASPIGAGTIVLNGCNVDLTESNLTAFDGVIEATSAATVVLPVTVTNSSVAISVEDGSQVKVKVDSYRSCTVQNVVFEGDGDITFILPDGNEVLGEGNHLPVPEVYTYTASGDVNKWTDAKWTNADGVAIDCPASPCTVPIKVVLSGNTTLEIDAAEARIDTLSVSGGELTLTGKSLKARNVLSGTVNIANEFVLDSSGSSSESTPIAISAKFNIRSGGRFQTDGYFDFTAANTVASGGEFVVASGIARLNAAKEQIKGILTIAKGATLRNVLVSDALAYNTSGVVVNVYGTLDMGETRWTIFANNNTLNLYAGAVVTGAGQGTYGALDIWEKTSGSVAVNVLKNGESTDQAVISAKVRFRDGKSVFYVEEGMSVDISNANNPDSNSGGLRVTGGGILNLAQANTYTAGTVVDGGSTVAISNVGSLGTGNVTGAGTVRINGGTYNNLNLSKFTDAATTVEIPAGQTVSGYFNKAIWSSPVKLKIDGALSYSNGYSGQMYTFTGPLSGSGTISLNGSMTDAVAFSGDTSGFTGKIVVSGKRCIAFGTYENTDTDDGKVFIASDGVITGAVTVEGQAMFADGATLDASSGGLVVTGNVTLNGSINLTAEPTSPSGYAVLTCANAASLDLNVFSEPPEDFEWAVRDGAVWVAPEVLMVAPGGDAVALEATDATAAENAVKLFVNVPAVQGLDRDTYAGYFKKTAVANGDGTFMVTAALDPDKVTPLIGESVAGAEDAFVIDEDGSVSITVANPKLGLYYGIKVMGAPLSEGDVVWFTDHDAVAPKSLRVSRETLDALVTSSPSVFFRVVVGSAVPEEHSSTVVE